MKKHVFFLILLSVNTSIFAQFGGGSGTFIDPYRLYTKSNLEELSDSLILGNPFSNIHFTLMNDISDSLRIPIGKNEFPFNGHFHGKGHNIVLGMDLRDSTQYSYQHIEYCLFPKLGEEAYLDSLSISGYIFASLGLVGCNYGTISSCVNNLTSPFTHNETYDAIGAEIFSAGICTDNSGGIIQNCINNSDLYGFGVGGITLQINTSDDQNITQVINCINNGNITLENDLFEAPSGGGIGGFNILGYDELHPVIIRDCKNYGNFYFTGNNMVHNVGGITGYIIGNTHIINCINFGNIYGKTSYCGGIAGMINYYTLIDKCSNYGNISGESNIGGICGLGAGFRISNCFNSGNISGSSYTGGIGFGILQPDTDTIYNCLNIGHINSSAIIANDDEMEINPLIVSNNYYDKQMCLAKGIANADVSGSAEGKLTVQLTGTSAELQTMLGDGWSYAEGRYPIPLGLENDSMALVAATPIYLYAENESNYNHVDSVTKNFTVGLQNNVAWTENNGRVSIDNENVTLLNVGVEKLVVSLGYYEKEIRINIEDTEVANPQNNIASNISVYPNPACKNITVNINGNSGIKLQIVDIYGKNVAQTINACEVNTIDISHLKEGMYFLQIFENGNVIYTQKIIKQE